MRKLYVPLAFFSSMCFGMEQKALYEYTSVAITASKESGPHMRGTLGSKSNPKEIIAEKINDALQKHVNEGWQLKNHQSSISHAKEKSASSTQYLVTLIFQRQKQ